MPVEPTTQETPEQILRHEFSEEFVQMMRNRMLQAFFRYGRVEDTKGKVDKLGCVQLRVNRYKETGNKEWLVDAANYLLMEFMYPDHEAAHFQATSPQESPGRVRTDGARPRDPNIT